MQMEGMLGEVENERSVRIDTDPQVLTGPP